MCEGSCDTKDGSNGCLKFSFSFVSFCLLINLCIYLFIYSFFINTHIYIYIYVFIMYLCVYKYVFIIMDYLHDSSRITVTHGVS